MIRTNFRKLLTLGLLGLACAASPSAARADLILGFSAPTYTITNVGLTATVSVVLTQTAAGPQVGVGNALLTAAIRVSYAPATGIANATAVAAPGWDSLSASALNSPIDISVISLSGFANMSSPLTIATLTFTGVAPGSINLTATQLDTLTPDFITEQGNILDPINTATATLTVQGIAAIPEPSPLLMGGVASGLFAAVGWARRRRQAA